MLQRSLHRHQNFMARTLAHDPFQRDATRREEQQRGVRRHLQFATNVLLGVGIHTHADELPAKPDDFRVEKRFVRHLMAVVTPTGGKEHQQRLALLRGFRQTLLVPVDERQLG